MISAPGSTGSRSITGTPTIRTSISWCAASADDGRDLVIDRDYIREGMRCRAEERVTVELGPRTEREIDRALRPRSRCRTLDQPRPALQRHGG